MNGRRARHDERHQPFRHPEREQDAARRAERGKQQALGDQLTNQPAASGAEREAHRQLALPCGCARQEEVGHVRARDQQYQPDHDEEDTEGLRIEIPDDRDARRRRSRVPRA